MNGQFALLIQIAVADGEVGVPKLLMQICALLDSSFDDIKRRFKIYS
jgi:hypothetical protein